MSHGGRSKITPRAEALHREARAAPSRRACREGLLRVLKRGRKTKADLLVVDVGGGPLVVKDFADKSWWVRLVGRLQVSREYRAYMWMGRLPGIPELIGRVDAHALALEHIDGAELRVAPERLTRGPELFARLREIVERIHATGVVHWDLRSRDNVVLRSDGRLVVIDFASAFRLRPGSLLHRWFFPWLRLVDQSALLKWQEVLRAGPLDEADAAFARRFRFWRSLWPFNRKSGPVSRGQGR